MSHFLGRNWIFHIFEEKIIKEGIYSTHKHILYLIVHYEKNLRPPIFALGSTTLSMTIKFPVENESKIGAMAKFVRNSFVFTKIDGHNIKLL